MAAVTVQRDFTEILPPGMAGVVVDVATTGDTYLCPYFAEIVGVVANNKTDDDGVGVAVSGQTITLTVGSSGDDVTLFIWGRK